MYLDVLKVTDENFMDPQHWSDDSTVYGTIRYRKISAMSGKQTKTGTCIHLPGQKLWILWLLKAEAVVSRPLLPDLHLLPANIKWWDLAEWLKRPTVNAIVATVLGSIPAFTGTVESERRQMTQCWIKYLKIQKIPEKKN